MNFFMLVLLVNSVSSTTAHDQNEAGQILPRAEGMADKPAQMNVLAFENDLHRTRRDANDENPSPSDVKHREKRFIARSMAKLSKMSKSLWKRFFNRTTTTEFVCEACELDGVLTCPGTTVSPNSREPPESPLITKDQIDSFVDRLNKTVSYSGEKNF
uniref:Uncharacterized protein n=1 Tax=Cacopsylla melanoneura TaxID=428564 RepID=A0A8D8Z6J0_9HEMI